MNVFKQVTKKMGSTALILGLCLILSSSAFTQGTVITFTGTTSADWNVTTNWDLGVVPTATHNVLIPEGKQVEINSGSASCIKLTVKGDNTGQGTLTIKSGATLTVAPHASITTGYTFSSVLLQGGLIENKGTLNAAGSTGSPAYEGIRYSNPTNAGTISSTYKGTGTLNVTHPAATPVASAGATGACVVFGQTVGTAIFEVGGTYSFTPPTAGTALYAAPGTAEFTGTGTITINGNYRGIRVVSFNSSFDSKLTIGANVTLALTGGLTTANTGLILLDKSSGATNTKASQLVNNGTINISGSSTNAIYIANNTASEAGVMTFENNGTLDINGTFSNLGAIVIAGSSTVGSAFKNLTVNGKVDYNTTGLGTSTKPLFYSGTAPVYTITNSSNSTIHVGANGTITNAILLGNTGATFDNFGTLTIDQGNIHAGGATAKFNNKSTGILNTNFVVNNISPVVAFNANINFTNDGKFKGTGAINAASTTATFNSTSTFEPSQPSSNTGRIVYYTSGTCNLSGTTFNADINGKAAPGTDFDQIGITSGSVNVTGMNIIVTKGAGYTPTNGDVIGLVISANGVTGTPNYTLPSGWAGSISGNNVVITYSAVLSVELISFTATPLSKSNKLTWVTATESNNKGFDIQRQTQTGDWATIGFVAAQGKAATYTFEDNNPQSISYYRLRQIDLDGKETYSKVVSVLMGKGGKLNAFPTIAKDNLTISVENTGIQTYNIYDLMGKNVQTGQFEGQKTLTVNDLPVGTYILKVGSETVKFLKN